MPGPALPLGPRGGHVPRRLESPANAQEEFPTTFPLPGTCEGKEQQAKRPRQQTAKPVPKAQISDQGPHRNASRHRQADRWASAVVSLAGGRVEAVGRGGHAQILRLARETWGTGPQHRMKRNLGRLQCAQPRSRPLYGFAQACHHMETLVVGGMGTTIRFWSVDFEYALVTAFSRAEGYEQRGITWKTPNSDSTA